MKKFKTIIFTLLLFLTITSAYCQVIKFKTISAASSRFVDKTQKWGSWDYGDDGKDILVSIDFTNERIKIYSKVEQVFDIIKYYDKTIDEDNDEVFAMNCVDKDGDKCKLRLITLKSQENGKQLYVGYSDITFLYNIYNLD